VPFGGVRPCGFALEAGVRRCRCCGGRVPEFSFASRGLPRGEPITSRAVEHPYVCGNRCRRDLPDHALIDCPSTSVGAGPRLPGSKRVIRRGRFSHAAFRTRPSNLRDLAGRSGFFPLSARRRSWGFALRRFAPELGWTRGVNPAAKWIATWLVAIHLTDISVRPGPLAC